MLKDMESTQKQDGRRRRRPVKTNVNYYNLIKATPSRVSVGVVDSSSSPSSRENFKI